jgi:hypothetical protein
MRWRGTGRENCPHKLPPHERKEALARKANGELVREIARTYNVSAVTISRLSA